MPNLNVAAEILAAVMVLAIPLTGPLERRIYRSDPDTRLKLLTYGVNFIALWALAVAAISIEGWGRLLHSPAPGVDWLWAPAISRIALSVVVAAYAIVGLLPLLQSLRGLRQRRAYAAAYRRGFADIAGLLPNTPAERAAWVALSLTAGICEELLYRGFLIHVLDAGGFGMPLAAALVVSSLLFGLAHFYQGLKGVAGTTVAGLVMGLLYLLSGNLIASIVLHALLDLQIAYVLRPTPGGASALVEAS